MRQAKAIWQDEDLHSGGYYELAIEVTKDSDPEPVRKLVQALFDWGGTQGPFTPDFEPVALDLEDFENIGYFEVGSKEVPFTTFYTAEEDEEGSQWLDVSIYTAMYEDVFGRLYRTWDTPYNPHPGLQAHLTDLLQYLHKVYPFRLGLIGYEVSGEYDLQMLKEQALDDTAAYLVRFFTAAEAEILKENWAHVEKWSSAS